MKISKEELKQIIVEEAKKAMTDPSLKELRLVPKGGGTARTCANLGANLGQQWAASQYYEGGKDMKQDSLLYKALHQSDKDTLSSRDSAVWEKVAMEMAEQASMSPCAQDEEYIKGFKVGALQHVEDTGTSPFGGIKPDTGHSAQVKTDRRTRGWDHIAAESLTRDIMKILEEVAK